MKADVASAELRHDTRHAKSIRLEPIGAGATADHVVFVSRGVVLVVGDDAGVLPHAAALAARLKVVVCAPGAQDAPGLPHSGVSLGGRVVSIVGHMGAFTARAAVSSDQSADIGAFGPNSDRTFDLILDLSSAPHFKQPLPPLGYFAPRGDARAIADALAILPTLVGRFVKPRFFEYAAGLCTHGAQGLSGCTRCMDVCSTGAIVSAGDGVGVDPYLCQGCATCSLACPTGALSFKPIERANLLTQCAQAISAARDDGIAQPVLVVRTARSRNDEDELRLPAAARELEVPALPAFGEEVWFAALAQGAAGVVLVADESLGPADRALICTRVELAQEILAAVGTRAERIVFAEPEQVADAVTAAEPTEHSGCRVSVPNPRATKRRLMLAAIDTLISGRESDSRPLPEGSPFGDVVVDRDRCTLCRACVNLCPTEALVTTTKLGPTLSFIEANCVQCGLCEVGCPENAITLRPRFVADAPRRGAPRLLHEDELASCTSCGTPFIGAKLLTASLALMKDFPGLADMGGVERLRLCPACRQRAVLDA